MSKLHFKYGSMSAGKSMHIIMTYYNYINLGLRPLAVVPNGCKSKTISSRTGAKIKAVSFKEFEEKNIIDYDVILIDESQFLTKKEVLGLHRLTTLGLPVICYGLRTNSEGEPFEGSKYLLALADNLEEIPSICHCGKKARMNLRLLNDKVDKGSKEIILKGNKGISYISVCRKCFIKYYEDNADVKDILKYDNTKKRRK